MSDDPSYTPAATYHRAQAAAQGLWGALGVIVTLAVEGSDVLVDVLPVIVIFAVAWLAVAAWGLRRVLRDVRPIQPRPLLSGFAALRRDTPWLPAWLVVLGLLIFAPQYCSILVGPAVVQLLLSLAVKRWEGKKRRTLIRTAGRRFGADFDPRDFGTV